MWAKKQERTEPMETRNKHDRNKDLIWNPWHGCTKYSEGCEHCYMYFLDQKYEKDGSEIYKTKTNFNLPLKKDRQKNYKIPAGSLVRVCMTSDFFLEEADEWRDEIWGMIRQRKDVTFWLQTKRAYRVKQCLPEDWGDGYDNIIICFTTENQRAADERIPILLSLPAKEKTVMVAPFIGPVSIEKYLKTGQIKEVIADGENYDGARPLFYDWVKKLYEECKSANVPFDFIGTGNVFIMNKTKYIIPKAYHRVQALKSGLQWPEIDTNIPVQKRCATCKINDTCTGCRWCGKCF